MGGPPGRPSAVRNALNAQTGAKLWSFTTGAWAHPPAVVNDTVYVGCYNNNVYALGNATPTRQLTQRSLSKSPPTPTAGQLITLSGTPSNHETSPVHLTGATVCFLTSTDNKNWSLTSGTSRNTTDPTSACNFTCTLSPGTCYFRPPTMAPPAREAFSPTVKVIVQNSSNLQAAP